MPIRVLLADDHAVLRKGLRLLLDGEDDITVVAEAGDGQEAIDLMREHSPDVVVMDVTMPHLGGIDATRRVVSEFPGTKVVALSIHTGKLFVEDMLRAGASGYILKESAPEELLEGVRAVMRGEVSLSRSLTGVVVSRYMSTLNGEQGGEGWESLTPREKEEIRWAVEGHSLQEIASILDIGEEEAEKAQNRIMKKLDAASVAELTELAHSRRWFDEETAVLGPTVPPAILQTKLHPPPVPAEHVCRPMLIDRLEQNSQKPLILVSAPAGYGKSTLVSCWAGGSGRPVAWLSVDEKESDLRTFLNYFLSAVETVKPGIFPETRAILSGGALPPLEDLAACLVNEITAAGEEYTLVIDDIHLLQDQTVHDLIAEILQHPPRTLHLILIGRRDPLLPLANLRARDRVYEIRVQELCFNTEQTAAYLEKTIGKAVEEPLAKAWTEKTEGWITGLQLAALSLSHRGDYESLLTELQGDSQYVMEYLFNEVLSLQTPSVRRCLLSTALLDRFCAPLAESVSGLEGGGESGWKFLKSIQSENLFVVKLDNENRWFRYHHLFQQLLLNQLERHFSPKEIAEFHSRASVWFAENGLTEEAIDHAHAAGNEDGAADLVEASRQSALNNDEWYVLEKWLTKFSEETLRQRPGLLLARAWVLYHHFELTALPAVLDAAESLLTDSPGDQALRGEVGFFRGYLCYFTNEGVLSLEHLETARKSVPPAHEEVCGQVETLYGLATHMAGRKEEAVDTLNAALFSDEGSQGVRRTRLLVTLVFIHTMAADLDQAAAANRQLHDFATQGNYTYALVWSLYLQALIEFYRNDLEAAKDYFEQVTEKIHILHRRAALDSMEGLALVCQALGHSERCRTAMESLREYEAKRSDPSTAVLVESCKARLSLLQAEPASAFGLLRASPILPENMAWWLEAPKITQCRVLLAEGSDESCHRAEVLLREGLQLNENNHNTLRMVEILSLLAVTASKQEKTDEAQAFLNRALDLSRHGGLCRPFAEAGPPMENLLKRTARDPAYSEQVRKLLSDIGGGGKGPAKDLRASRDLSVRAQPLVEPLTKREIELLEQLAQRFSNNEIAENLYISPATVKTHLKSIFQKLDVGNRREAVARAVELGILR